MGARCKGAGVANHLWIGDVGVELSRAAVGAKTHDSVRTGDHDKILVSIANKRVSGWILIGLERMRL